MRLGAWSAVLLVFALQALVLAGLVIAAQPKRAANLYLGALLIVCAGLATPFILGYAGAYDAWPWLSFAPFAAPLAIGPLVYAYVVATANERPIALWHFLLPAAHFLYQAVMFIQPLTTKAWVDANIQEPVLSPLMGLLIPLSLFAYAAAGWRTAQGYENWLKSRRRQQTPARRLRVPLALLTALALIRLGFEVFDWTVRRLDYFDLFSFYVALGIISVWLGIDAWRNTGAPAPVTAPAPERDWAAMGKSWSEAISTQELWRAGEANLDTLASALGTNRTSLSRALNAAGESLTELLARLRAEEAAKRLLAEPDADILTIALDAGFGSKAAFNRIFKARFGATPSDYRANRGLKA